MATTLFARGDGRGGGAGVDGDGGDEGGGEAAAEARSAVCAARGACVGVACVCEPGYEGRDCSQRRCRGDSKPRHDLSPTLTLTFNPNPKTLNPSRTLTPTLTLTLP